LDADELRRVATAVLSGGGELMMTIAEQWEQQGIEKGIPVGEVLLLKRQLTRRFGPIPQWVEAKLAEAEPAQLEVWGERVLDAPLLEAVFGE
jgi:predicted transposase YdaD